MSCMLNYLIFDLCDLDLGKSLNLCFKWLGISFELFKTI